jgi:hypothetical protein
VLLFKIHVTFFGACLGFNNERWCNEIFSVLKVGFLAWKMALNFKIRLYSVEDGVSRPELLSPFFCQTGDTYADLRTRLENGGCVEWPFFLGLPR